MRTVYSEEQKRFMREYACGHTYDETAEEMNRRFGTELTCWQIKYYVKNHGLHTGMPKGPQKGIPTELWPEEVDAFIEAHLKGNGPTSMKRLLDERWPGRYTEAQVKGHYAHKKYNSGETGWFRKGNIPPNKGKRAEHVTERMRASWFQKGSIPHNAVPIGTVKTAEGYIYVKTRNGHGMRNWESLGRILYEKEHGKLPENVNVIYLDGDATNLSPENLMAIDRAVNARLTVKGRRSRNAELTRAGAALTTLEIEIRRKRGKKGGKNKDAAEDGT